MDLMYSIIFVLILSASVSTVRSNESITKWMTDMNDIRYDCTDYELEDLKRSQELFSVVDCEAKDAIYAYRFTTDDKAKPKRGGQLNGQGMITLALKNENGKFNFGLKFGKCLNIRYKNARSFSGQFVADRLQGRVVVQNADDTQTVIFVRDSRPVGLVRTFDNERLVNVTNVLGENVWSQDKLGGYRIGYALDDRSGSRTLFTVSFDPIYDCHQIDSAYLTDCHLVESIEAEVDKCKIKIKSIMVEEVAFHYNVYREEKFYPLKDDPYKYCPNKSDYNHINASGSIKDWVENISNVTNDPFWMLGIDMVPFDPNNPVLDVVLNHYTDRTAFAPRTVEVHSSTKRLIKAEMSSGRIISNISNDSINLPEWKAPLLFHLQGQEFSIGDGLVLGNIAYQSPEHVVVGKLRHGRLHGPVRIFGKVANDPRSGCAGVLLERGLAFVGHYDNGKPTGHCWRGLLGGGWIYGKVDEQGEFSGDDIAYVYPDLRTALFGTFRKGVMVAAREVKVIGDRCDQGIKLLQFSEPKGSEEYHYDPPSKNSFGDQPHLRDPIDKKYVYLKPSLEIPLAGEGAFAVEDTPANTVFLIYSGHRLNEAEMKDFERDKNEELNTSEDKEATRTQQYQDWKYRIAIKQCAMTLDIPAEFEPVEKYQGSLGHKVNHKFDPTTKYMQIDSPRFGVVNAVRTLKDIKKDEEFFVNYGYGGITPEWHREEWQRYLKEHPELAPKTKVEEVDSVVELKDTAISMSE